MDAKFTELVEQLNGLDFKGMYGSDFLHTWDRPPMSSRRSTSSPTPARAAREQRLVQDLRLGSGRLSVPRQLHPYAVLLL